jgi:hypothetical protein
VFDVEVRSIGDASKGRLAGEACQSDPIIWIHGPTSEKLSGSTLVISVLILLCTVTPS